MRRTFRATEIIFSVYVGSTEAVISRSLFKRGVTVSDEAVKLLVAVIWEALVILSYMAMVGRTLRRDFAAGLEAFGFVYFWGVMRYVQAYTLAAG